MPFKSTFDCISRSVEAPLSQLDGPTAILIMPEP